MHRNVSHRLHFACGPSIGTPKGLLTTLTTRNIVISSFDERFFNQLQKYTANTKKLTIRSDWRGRSCTRKIEVEASQKNQADENGRGRHMRATWRTGYAADIANIQKQTVRSDWRGRSRTWKIEEEVSQNLKNQADETGRRGYTGTE